MLLECLLHWDVGDFGFVEVFLMVWAFHSMKPWDWGNEG